MWEKYSEAAENVVEYIVFASRWLLAPFYVGLGVLTLVDLSLTGSLLLIVIFSGYENFVSKIDHSGHRDWPEWMGTIDFTALKLKLLSSIVAISAIQLLKQFMSIKDVSDRDLMWLVIIH